jgi:hypothetical protein
MKYMFFFVGGFAGGNREVAFTIKGFFPVLPRTAIKYSPKVYFV